MHDSRDLKKVIDLLKDAKSSVEKARINAPVPLSLCLSLATVSMDLQRDIDRCQRIIDALNKDSADISVIVVKTK